MSQPFKNVIYMEYTVYGEVTEYQLKSTLLRLGYIRWTLHDLRRLGKISDITVDAVPNKKESTGTVTLQLGSDVDHTSIEYYIEEIERVNKFVAKFNTIYSGPAEHLRSQKKSYLSKKAAADRNRASGSMANLAGLAHGKNIDRSRWIILVEGAADVGRLSQLEYRNTLEVGGARLDDRALAFARTKEKIIAFMDGDEEGIDNLRRLGNALKIDEPLLADKGIEVENLPLNRIREILEPASKKMSRELL